MAENKVPRAVIFDWNGTLNDMRVVADQDIVFARQYGHEWTYDDIRKMWGRPADQLFRLLVPSSDKPWQELRGQFRELDAQFPRRLQPHVAQTLGDLSTAGVRMAVVTSGEGEIVRGRYMAQAELPTEHFDFMHFSAEIEAARAEGHADMEPAVQAFAAQGIERDEIILVGDEQNDFENAQAAGIGFIAVTNGTKTVEELSAVGVSSDRTIPDLSYLPGILGVAS